MTSRLLRSEEHSVAIIQMHKEKMKKDKFYYTVQMEKVAAKIAKHVINKSDPFTYDRVLSLLLNGVCAPSDVEL